MTFPTAYRRVCRLAPELDYPARVQYAARMTQIALMRRFSP
jgi:hypothetical protein